MCYTLSPPPPLLHPPHLQSPLKDLISAQLRVVNSQLPLNCAYSHVTNVVHVTLLCDGSGGLCSDVVSGGVWRSPSVSINSFDYISSVLSYALVGIPVFLGKYDHYSPAALSSVISEVRSTITTIHHHYHTTITVIISFLPSNNYFPSIK